MINLGIGDAVEAIITWLTTNLDGLFDFIAIVLGAIIDGLEWVLAFEFLQTWGIHPIVSAIILTVLLIFAAWKIASKGVALFTLIGMFLVYSMNMWDYMIATLALVLTSTLVALVLGIPLGIWMSKKKVVEKIVRPILDFMQTMPAFVYLIPAVFFFSLGAVPGVVATVIFAMPPAVRLTNLGIHQVPGEVVEATKSFGATPRQLLFKVELPLATATILAGVNQTIMLALSMVVIAAMIGAGGLGDPVLKGITQLKIGLGFEGGLAVVIVAIVLDRITQALGTAQKT